MRSRSAGNVKTPSEAPTPAPVPEAKAAPAYRSRSQAKAATERLPFEEVPAEAKPAEPVAAKSEAKPALTSNDEVDKFIGDMPALSSGYASIVRTTFTLPDPDVVAREIEAELAPIRPSRSDRGELVDALDRIQDVARRAAQLHLNAKLAVLSYEIDARVVLGAMRENANARLQRDKAAGLRSKAITDADIESQMATAHPDEYRQIVTDLERAKLSVRYLEAISERAVDRARDLRSIIAAAP